MHSRPLFIIEVAYSTIRDIVLIQIPRYTKDWQLWVKPEQEMVLWKVQVITQVAVLIGLHDTADPMVWELYVEGRCYIDFKSGPSENITTWILRVLKQNHAICKWELCTSWMLASGLLLKHNIDAWPWYINWSCDQNYPSQIELLQTH